MAQPILDPRPAPGREVIFDLGVWWKWSDTYARYLQVPAYDQLPAAMRGLANLVEIVPSKNSREETR